jgi:alpha/beta superfamily hydrolase
MSETVLVPGTRDVRATFDAPSGGAEACVVACPPHPQFGGSRTDRRLRAVADALVDRGVACLRFDYGDWDEGYGEREDARNAVRWAGERYDAVALFGYSFGGCQALLAGATVDVALRAVAALAPASRIADDLDAVAALDDIVDAGVPVQVVYGERDEVADWRPVVERARERDCDVVAMGADHHFVGQDAKVATHVTEFLRPLLAA